MNITNEGRIFLLHITTNNLSRSNRTDRYRTPSPESDVFEPGTFGIIPEELILFTARDSQQIRIIVCKRTAFQRKHPGRIGPRKSRERNFQGSRNIITDISTLLIIQVRTFNAIPVLFFMLDYGVHHSSSFTHRRVGDHLIEIDIVCIGSTPAITDKSCKCQ